MNKSIELIILHRGNTPEIVESLKKEARTLGLNCIEIDAREKIENIKLAHHFYLFYSVLNRTNSEPIISVLSEKCRLIHYTLGRTATLSKSKALQSHEIPYIGINSKSNDQLLEKINEFGGFPVLFSSDKFSNSLGKYYIENEHIFLQVIDTIRSREEFDYILKYIEHDFHFRIYIIDYQFNSAVVYYKDKNDYSTNRLEQTERPKMSFLANISPYIKQLAINHARYLHVETVGIDILVSRNNEYYILEANNPMIYSALSASLPIVSKGIIQGLLNKYNSALLPGTSTLPTAIPLVISNQLTNLEKDFLEVMLTCKQLNLSHKLQEHIRSGTPAIILNSKHFLANTFHPKSYGYNAAKHLSIQQLDVLIKSGIRVWLPYQVNISIPDKLKPANLENNCLFPLLLKVEIEHQHEMYLKINSIQQCIAIISLYQDIQYTCSLYPYIYVDVRRKVLLVKNKVIAALEYVHENNGHAITDSKNLVSIDTDKISVQEHALFNTLSVELGYQGAWILEYATDIQAEFHLLSYDNGYDIDDFCSTTSDLLVPLIITNLFLAYHATLE
jgi:hypothetical protein